MILQVDPHQIVELASGIGVLAIMVLSMFFIIVVLPNAVYTLAVRLWGGGDRVHEVGHAIGRAFLLTIGFPFLILLLIFFGDDVKVWLNWD
jgi:Na+-driven multidrug efflux pump